MLNYIIFPSGVPTPPPTTMGVYWYICFISYWSHYSLREMQFGMKERNHLMEESSRLAAFSRFKLLSCKQESLSLIQWLHKDHSHEEYICQAELRSCDNIFSISKNSLAPPGIFLCNVTSMAGKLMSFNKTVTEICKVCKVTFQVLYAVYVTDLNIRWYRWSAVLYPNMKSGFYDKKKKQFNSLLKCSKITSLQDWTFFWGKTYGSFWNTYFYVLVIENYK